MLALCLQAAPAASPAAAAELEEGELVPTPLVNPVAQEPKATEAETAVQVPSGLLFFCVAPQAGACASCVQPSSSRSGRLPYSLPAAQRHIREPRPLCHQGLAHKVLLHAPQTLQEAEDAAPLAAEGSLEQAAAPAAPAEEPPATPPPAAVPSPAGAGAVAPTPTGLGLSTLPPLSPLSPLLAADTPAVTPLHGLPPPEVAAAKAYETLNAAMQV